MKLDRPLTDSERQRVQTALGTLQSTHAAFESKLAAFGAANVSVENVGRQHTAARRQGHLSAGEQQTVEALTEQLSQVQARSTAARGEMEAARQTVSGAIQQASKVIRTLCTPLLDQFEHGLAAALQPFCTDCTGTVAAIRNTHTELPALQSFLHRGHQVSRVAGPEEIERLAFELGRTLQSILDGGEIWQPSKAAAESLQS